MDEVFTMKKKDSSSVSLRLPPSPTGEGFFHTQKAKKKPRARRGENLFCKQFFNFFSLFVCVLINGSLEPLTFN
ncbi:MAG: hypothetical protein IIW21_07945, partial [Clostridia bacterium]|nr:hypothetical protein [Clostridia bacterium]